MSEHHSQWCMLVLTPEGTCSCDHSDNKTKYDSMENKKLDPLAKVDKGGYDTIPLQPATKQPGQGVKFGETANMIREECDNLAAMLIQKNEAYGDSAISPKRIFSRADSVEQIKVRIDDKLSRMANQKDGQDAMGEDIEKDLLGYLILLRVARRKTTIRWAGLD